MMNIQSHQITHRATAVRVVTRPVSVVNATMSSSGMLCVSIPESGRVGMSVTLSKYADDPSKESQKLVMSYTRYEDGWDARLTVEGVGDFDVDALGHPMYPTPDVLFLSLRSESPVDVTVCSAYGMPLESQESPAVERENIRL